MNIVHIVPQPCIFEATILKYSNTLNQECFFYRVLPRIGMDPRSFLSLYWKCRLNPDSLFIFHKVPHFAVLVLTLLIKDFRYALLYWGEDYYFTFLPEEDFEAHCISKSPTLQAALYQRPQRRFKARWIQSILRSVGLVVLQRAAGIVSLCPKQFRILRIFHLRQLGAVLSTPQMWMRGYSRDNEAGTTLYSGYGDAQSLTVLICHSAAVTVAHRQTLALLRTYTERWNTKVHIRGFLSYSGGDEADRDQLEQELMAQADFAESICFERSFMTLEEVSHRLKEIDIAIFSCLRDEGVSLLTQFVKIGGIVSFNQFSINYNFFKTFSPSKLLTHEQFLGRAPQEIRDERQRPPVPPPKMLTFEELNELCLEKGKLVFHPNSQSN